ncbi:MAG: hypothetical protein JWP29_1500 [Rhodoferax sp.]|nr:hypothetical protein [Rhodoferax sp.]
MPPILPTPMPLYRALRLGSGLVLWLYMASHLLNHALGVVSLDVAEQGLRVAVAVWHSAVGTLFLYGAFALHVLLAMLGLYQRHTLRLPAVELLRIGAGLSIPMLLVGHAVATRMAYEWYGHLPHYARVVTSLLHTGAAGRQLALLAPGWLHGCMGLHMAARKNAVYQRWRWFALGAAVLLPCLAAGGYLQMVREASAALAAAPSGSALRAATEAAQTQALDSLRLQILTAYGALLALVLLARGVRRVHQHRISA